MYVDIIKQNGIFYKLSSENRSDFIENEIFLNVLPEDKVEYERVSEKILINKIVERKSQVTIGIQFNNILTLPLLSRTFKKVLDEYVNTISVCLVKISDVIGEIDIVKTYGSIKDRSKDNEILNDVYNDQENYAEFKYRFNTLFLNIDITNSLYTTDKRVDLTHLHTFNIDPAHSLDFDDAVSVDIENNKVYIHLVDIAFLTGDKDEEETRAFYSGFTLYLLEKNYNIFPPELSEDRFSLIKDKDREVITIEFSVDVFGNVLETEIYPSMIKIKERYNYENALEELENNNPYMIYLEKLMWKTSDINIPKRSMILGENGEIKRIEIHQRTKTNKLIESLMIKANEAVSKILKEGGRRLERHHADSNLGKIDTSKLTELESMELIKKYKVAKYSDVESGHFGLQLDNYTHFTSPIRRGFDILVHNMLSGLVYNKQDLEWIIGHLNTRERLNDSLHKFYEKCKLFSYMERNKDKTYTSTIINITPNGMRFIINDLLYTDFVHISKILDNIFWLVKSKGEDLYLEDRKNKTLLIQKQDKVNVKIEGIDWVNLKVKGYKISL